MSNSGDETYTSSVPLGPIWNRSVQVNVAAPEMETFRGQQEVFALRVFIAYHPETTSTMARMIPIQVTMVDQIRRIYTDGDDDSTTDGDSDDSTGDDENNGNPVQMVHPVMRIRPQTQKAPSSDDGSRQTMRPDDDVTGQRQTGQMGPDGGTQNESDDDVISLNRILR